MNGLSELISFVRRHPRAHFYRDRWGSTSAFEALPTVSRSEMASVPLSARRYRDTKGMTKVVAFDTPFLSEWDFEDIRSEPYGVASRRPMVHLSDPHETIEKAMWCHLNDMVCLVGERNSAIVRSTASQYEIDSLITDGEAILDLVPYLAKRRKPLIELSIIGAAFDAPALAAYAPYAQAVRCVLALPETGAFAEAALTELPAFRVLPECVIECVNGAVVLTRQKKLVTPIVRYATGILAESAGTGLIRVQ